MARRTSIKAYYIIKANGLLSKLKWTVYDHIHELGPISIRDAIRNLSKRGIYGNSVSTRFSELQKLGVIDICGETTDVVSGHTVFLWDVIDRLPVKWEKLKKIKCDHCAGKGYHIEQQSKLDV